MRYVIFFVVFLVVQCASAAPLNAKSVDSITLRIVQNGELAVTGDVQHANLTIYIPQEGLKDIKVSSNAEMSWRYATDKMGNRFIALDWQKPSGTVTYSIESLVENSAKSFNPTEIGNDPRYLNETKSIVINSDVRQLAYPYEKSWENVARLTQLVYDMVDYDSTLSGARKSSDWVLENKRGVCVEHANLLAALLRASGIPTRYVVGYAYSSIDEKLIGHAWVEVLSSDGWVPFDPTWLEGGYLDATHIKTANLLDDNQIELLTYTGNGKITWKRGDGNERSPTSDLYGDRVEIISYTQRNITSIDLMASKAPKNGYGYVRAIAKPESCLISQMKIATCIDAKKTDAEGVDVSRDVLQFYERERKFYSCSAKEIFWFFKEAGSGAYTCPVSIYDQTGSSASIDVETTTRPAGGAVSISGPDTAGVNERFTLRAQASTDFIFYSPDFGRSRDDAWSLSINRPGEYKFYLYENGAIAIKEVKVVAKKEFDLFVDSPSRANASGNFTATIRTKNTGASKSAILIVEFDGAKSESNLKFGAFEQKNISVILLPARPGTKEIIASIQADTLTTYTASVTVDAPKKDGSFLDEFVKAILGALKGVKEFFGSIFVRK